MMFGVILKLMKLRFLKKKFVKQTRELINKARSYNSKVIFIGFPGVDENLTTPWSYGGEILDEAWYNKDLQSYELLQKRVCEENNVPYLPLYTLWQSEIDIKTHLSDGLHPNSLGHEWIYNKVKSFIIDDAFVKFCSNQE